MSCFTCIFICLVFSIIYFNVSSFVFCLLRSMAIFVNSWIFASKLNMSSAVSCSLCCLDCSTAHPVGCFACSPLCSIGRLSNPVTFFLNSCTSASKLKISSAASGSLGCVDCSPSRSLGCVDCSPSRSLICVGCSPSLSRGSGDMSKKRKQQWPTEWTPHTYGERCKRWM